MTASGKLSTLEVSNALRRLTVKKTKHLLFHMGVPLGVLDDIADEFKGEDRKQHFVRAWLDMDPDASWDKLVVGLKKIDQNYMATEIENKHHLNTVRCSDSSPPVPTVPTVARFQPSNLRVEGVKASIEFLEEEYSDIKHEAQRSLIKKQEADSDVFNRFRDHLLDLPVSKKQVHVRFFTRNEDDILKAETFQKLFLILGRYCNYSNYEIIFHIVKRFCHDLKGRMLKYRGSITTFEKSTTVDIYLCAISARPGGEISLAFTRMTMKLNKPPSECSLYEIRELKESIEEKASLESYAMYIEAPGVGSVCARLRFPKEVGWMVGVVLTPDFKQENRVTEVSVKDWPWLGEEGLVTYLNRELRSASRRGDVEAVISLITAGANVTDVSRIGSSALMEAGKKGEPKVVSLLLEAGANIDLQNKDGSSALMEAARLGKTEAVSLLLKAGAALDLQNMQGDSAVILATANYHLPVLKELVRAGADLNLQNEDGLTALMISSRFGKTDLTETLVSGANISLDIQTTNNGWSALFFAVDKGHVPTTKLLLKKGADPHLSDHSKLTIMDVATAGCHEHVQELLRKFIANPSTIDTVEDSPADSTQDPQPPQYIESLQKVPESPPPEYTESEEPPQSAESYHKPPQSAESSWEPPQLADSSQNPPQSSQGPPQLVDTSQEPPQSVDSSQEPPQSVDSSQEPPQSVDLLQGPPQSAESTQEPPQSAVYTQEPPQSAVYTQEPTQSAESTQVPPQSAESIQEPPQSAESIQEPPQSAESTQEPPQSAESTQEPPQSVDSSQEPPRSAALSQEPTQHVDLSPSNKTAIVSPQRPAFTFQHMASQAIRDLVKSARKSGNQAFSRLQKRIFRLEKKDQQEGDNNMGRKSLRPDSGPDIPLPSYDDIIQL